MSRVSDKLSIDDDLFEGLKAIWDTEFPKTCPKCGRVYQNFDAYIDETVPPPGTSGLMAYDVGREAQQVGIFRDCACGTTIMAFCYDRRDLSDAGHRRRALFAELLERLVDSGVSVGDARAQLLNALRTAPERNALKRSQGS